MSATRTNRLACNNEEIPKNRSPKCEPKQGLNGAYYNLTEVKVQPTVAVWSLEMEY